MNIPCLTFGYFFLIVIILSITIFPLSYSVIGDKGGKIVSGVIATSVFIVFLYTLLGDRDECKMVGTTKTEY